MRNRSAAGWSVLATSLALCSCSTEDEIQIAEVALEVATLGQPYRAEFAIVPGEVSGVEWSIVEGTLPPGLLLDGNGQTATLFGTPDQEGTFIFSVRARAPSGNFDDLPLSLVVAPVLEITTANLSAGAVNVAYAQPLEAAGGSDVTWSISAGQLPPGLTLVRQSDSAATIEGVPAEMGTFGLTVQVEDGFARSVERVYEVTIVVLPLEIETGSLPSASQGTIYRQEVTASGGTGDYAWSVASGALPDGLVLGAEGTPTTVLLGTPSTVGTSTFTVEVMDSEGEVAERAFTLTVEPAVVPLEFVEPVLPSGRLDETYTATLTAAGGTGNYVWTVVSGALPDGLALEPNGTPSTRLAGVPRASGDFDFSVRVVDSGDRSAERVLRVRVVGDLAIATTELPSALECRAFRASLRADGDPGLSHTWTATLPAGLRLESSGGLTAEIVGTPTETGTQTVSLAISDPSRTVSVTLALEVPPDPDGRRWVAMVGDVAESDDIGVHVADLCGDVLGLAEPVSPPAPGFGDASPGATDQVRFAPGGRALAFVGDFRENLVNELFVVNLDPRGHGPAVRVSGEQNPGGLVSDFRWSPDGTRIVYRADQDVDGRFELYYVDLAFPGDAVRVNPDFPDEGDVFADDFSWSGDGRWLAYQADGTLDGTNEVYVADLLTGPPFSVFPVNRPLPDGGDVFDDFQWLPDGGALLIRADMREDTVVELFVVGTATASPGAPRVLNGALPGGGDVASFALSPTGAAVAYIADETTNGTDELYVVTLQGAEPQGRRRVSAPLVAGGNVVAFRWSEDGSRLLYVADGRVDERFELYYVDGSELTRARPISGTLPAEGDVRATSVDGLPDTPTFGFSGDGRWAAFVADSAIDTAEALHVVNLDAAEVRTIVDETFTDGDRTSQDPPASLSWATSGASSRVAVVENALSIDARTGSRHVAAHFPRRSLLVGDRLTLEFDFSVTAPIDQANGLRVALFDSGGSPVVVTDGLNPDVLHEGYAAFTNLVPANADPLSLRKRDGSTPGRLLTTAAVYTRLGAAGGPTVAFEEGPVYRAELTILRTGADEAQLTVRFTGGGLETYELTQTDLDAVTTFDGVAIAVSSSNSIPASDMLVVDNLTVSAGGGLAEPVVVSPVPVSTSTVVDFLFAPDSSLIAYRSRLDDGEVSEVYAASLSPGGEFALGNVLHGVLPSGAATEDLSVNLGWTRDATGVIVAKDLGAAGVLEAWRLRPEGGQSPVRLHGPLPTNGNVEFVVIPP